MASRAVIVKASSATCRNSTGLLARPAQRNSSLLTGIQTLPQHSSNKADSSNISSSLLSVIPNRNFSVSTRFASASVAIGAENKIGQGQTCENQQGPRAHQTHSAQTEAHQVQAHGPLYEYERRIQQGKLHNDDYQRDIVTHLQDLHDDLLSYKPIPVVRPPLPTDSKGSGLGSLFSSLFGSSSTSSGHNTEIDLPSDLPKGLYLFGDVGCGKTMLMDLFYDTLPDHITSRKRVHFHNFMQDVHRSLHVVKMNLGQGGKINFDAVPHVAADTAEQSSVLCFDEFQCTDVADAMILRRLLQSLMSHGVVIVMTSNRHPDDLYKNGVQRQSFIPCIDLLKKQLTVINLDSPTDYRKIPRPPSGVYYTSLDSKADAHADKWFEYLGDMVHDPPHPAVQHVWGRKITVPVASGRAARFTFEELLARATGAADYLELVKHYDSFIVTGVPAMTLDQRDLARRFITFVDAVYEGKGTLVLTTAVPLPRLFLTDAELKLYEAATEAANDRDNAALSSMRIGSEEQEIFAGDEERFAFSRALSRLVEMGSTHWVDSRRTSR
ncbi:hypothetical protein KEM54_000904 [Ascosphaera aggregata]|nr:hypothetical protein KEM54_000904 [Ascosphaera aggregata]